jgi:ATP-dependent DNA helicase RecG
MSGLMLSFQANPQHLQAALDEDSVKTPLKTPDMILAALGQNPDLSISEIVRQVEKSDIAVKRAIRKLREDGRLERIGSARGGSWKVLGLKA